MSSYPATRYGDDLAPFGVVSSLDSRQTLSEERSLVQVDGSDRGFLDSPTEAFCTIEVPSCVFEVEHEFQHHC